MKSNYMGIAQEFKRRLLITMPVIDMRVFGSFARGDAQQDSDIDIFIEIESLTKKNKEHIRDVSWQVSLDNATVISPIIFSRNELEHSALRSSPVVENIMREGISV